MTKCEPFAKVVILSPLDDSGQEARALLVGGVEVCHYPFWPSDGEDPAESDSVKINASHEARVKEECEKVRFETVRLCADKADRMGSEEIRNAIMFETGRQ